VLTPGGRLFPVRDQDLPLMYGFPVLLIGLILWIACANVATMMLARSGARQKEVAVRLALGASRGRLIRQLLTESVLIAIIAGLLGFAFAWWSNRSFDEFKAMMPTFVDLDLRVSWGAFAFSFLLSLLTGVLFGLSPALQATKVEISQGLRPAAAPKLHRYRWYSGRNILIVQQMAASLMVLLFAAFIVVGFQRHAGVDLGFEARDLYSLSVDPIRDGYSEERTRVFFRNLPDRLRNIPGLLEVSVTDAGALASLSSEASTGGFVSMDQHAQAVKATRTAQVGANYFETVGIGLMMGRTFRDSDIAKDNRRIVVNEAMAAEAWPGKNPLGQLFARNDIQYEVIGVVKNVRTGTPLEPMRPVVYHPMDPERLTRPAANGVIVLVRAAPGVDTLTLVRREIAAMDPNLSVFNARAVQTEINALLYLMQYSVALYGGIGVFSLVLAALGLGGITAYAVARRSKEIGIRISLGATRWDVMRLVLTEGTVIILVGSVIGFGGAFAATRVISAFFDALASITQTTIADPLLAVGAPALLAGLGLLSCWLPARKALRIDPMKSLRTD